jgi:phosphoenolpyruvate carboxylase
MEQRKIPRIMSSQHPDNVRVPFFANTPDMAGDSEIYEANYIFSTLGADEQMWDFEGKETTLTVVDELLKMNPDFFSEHKIGADVFITLRVPNPRLEKTAEIQQKIKLFIDGSAKIGQDFYRSKSVPIFEAIVPFTQSVVDLIHVFDTYNVQPIALFEDETMLQADAILKKYVGIKKNTELRVLMAQSDPAMHMGYSAALIMNKLGLQRLYNLRHEGITVHPILGAGSVPFRGGFNPYTTEQILQEFPSVSTFMLQSSAKFDYSENEVQKAIQFLKYTPVEAPTQMSNEITAEEMIKRFTLGYKNSVVSYISDLQKVALHIPARRQRRSHTGKDAYARSIHNNILPRAIGFTCSMYSLGIPPELIGIEAISLSDKETMCSYSPAWISNMEYAGQFLDPDILGAQEILKEMKRLGIVYVPNDKHIAITRLIQKKLKQGENVTEEIESAARIRNFLG